VAARAQGCSTPELPGAEPLKFSTNSFPSIETLVSAIVSQSMWPWGCGAEELGQVDDGGGEGGPRDEPASNYQCS